MSTIIRMSAAGLGLVCFAMAGFAQASPLFSIGEGSSTSWQDGITAGNVRAVPALNGMTQAESDFYANEALAGGHAGFELRDAFLTPDLIVSDGLSNHQALVMAWGVGGSGSNDVGDVAAWEYVYDIDPDLTGLFLEFSLLAPSGVWDVSVELIDINGRTKSWFWPGPVNTWATYTIDLSSNAAFQGPFMLWPVDPLFDIMQVTAIRFDESGIWSMPFPPPPVGAAVPPAPVGWNAWNHVRVIPEPSAVVLAGIVALGAIPLVARRMPRARKR